MTRGQLVKQGEWKFPDLGTFGYLVEIIQDIGVSEGRAPLSWKEIEAFQKVTGIPLALWEAKIIRTASQAYVQALGQYTDSGEMSPLEAQGQKKQEVGDRLKTALRAIRDSRKKQ